MAGGKLSHKKTSSKAKDFASKQDFNPKSAPGQIRPESGQGTQDRGPIGQFTGAGDAGLQKK